MTTELQKFALDALDMLGRMTFCELQTACLIEPEQRGGFRASINRLFDRKLVAADESQMWITAAGVHEVERVNYELEKQSTNK